MVKTRHKKYELVDEINLNDELDKNDAIGQQHETVGDLTKDMTKDWDSYLEDCILEGKKVLPNKDFFINIVILPDKMAEGFLDRLSMKHTRQVRSSCPTPDYNQVVYHYKHQDNKLSFLWTVPTRDMVGGLLRHRDRVLPQYFDLLIHVLNFADGSLLKLAKHLNGEYDKELISGVTIYKE